MTDPSNTAPNQDKQMSRKVAEMTGESIERDDNFIGGGTSDKYEEGVRVLKKAGYDIVITADGFFDIYKSVKAKDLEPIKGITFPSWFRPKKLVTTSKQLSELGQAFKTHAGGKDANEDLMTFWRPLWDSHKPNEPLFEYARYLKRQEENEPKKRVLHYNHTLDPSGKTIKDGTKCSSPKSWLPALSWFDQRVIDDVRFEDVFSIFPYAEQQILKLLLGRAVVGRKNQMYPNSPHLIKHTARMLGIILGVDAGLI